jgi:hypothetical protein
VTWAPARGLASGVPDAPAGSIYATPRRTTTRRPGAPPGDLLERHGPRLRIMGGVDERDCLYYLDLKEEMFGMT